MSLKFFSFDLRISYEDNPTFEGIYVDANVVGLHNVEISSRRFKFKLAQVRPKFNVPVSKEDGAGAQVGTCRDQGSWGIDRCQSFVLELEIVLSRHSYIDVVNLKK